MSGPVVPVPEQLIKAAAMLLDQRTAWDEVPAWG